MQVFGSKAIVPYLTDPTYTLPILVASVTAVAVAWWAFGRRTLLPDMTPYVANRPWMQRPDTAAYLGATEGHYVPAVELLGRRLGEALYSRFQLRLDDHLELLTDPRVPPLPAGGDVAGLVEELFRAYRSAQRAETPNLGNGWPWLRRHRREVAVQDFERVTQLVAEALPVLEGA